jgi:hypothetical protein
MPLVVQVQSELVKAAISYAAKEIQYSTLRKQTGHKKALCDTMLRTVCVMQENKQVTYCLSICLKLFGRVDQLQLLLYCGVAQATNSS